MVDQSALTGVIDANSGTEGSYQRWADTVGDSTFSFSNILPFFKNSVKFTPPNYAKRGAGGPVLFNSSGFSDSGAPLHVSYPNYWAPIATFLQHSFASLGLKDIPGFNTGELIGYAEFATTTEPTAETRSSSETSFLQESLISSSLLLYHQTLVERILFDNNKTATGIKVSTAGVPYVLTARKEIILSAGVVSIIHAPVT